MKALIIAAGQGRRLSDLTKAGPKPLIQLLGLSLIERVVLTARGAGIDEFVVTVGYLGDRIRATLGDGGRFGVGIDYALNKEWENGNGVSVLSATPLLNENFILLMSDHIFDDRILKELVDHELGSSAILAVDRKAPSPGDMRVLERSGKIVSIGKEIEESNCIDTGIFLCSPRMFAYAEEAVKEGKTELADVIDKAASNGEVEVFDVTGIESYASEMRKKVKPWWIDIDTEGDLVRAKEIILENASKEPSDALAYYVHKPIENRLVAFISRSSITPNQVTVVVNVLAYAATALFFLGHLFPASMLTFVVGITDGLDGKLARVKLKTSKLGALEHSFDLLFEFSWFIGLSWFLFGTTQSAAPLILCMFIILFISFYRHVYDQFRRTMGKSLDDAGDFERIFRRVAGRRNLYNIEILVGILLGVPLYSLILVLLHSAITAAVYSSRAIKHTYIMDRHNQRYVPSAKS